MRKVPSFVDQLHKPLSIRAGQELSDLEEFFAHLRDRGYERVKRVRERGEYSFKGGAIDIFVGCDTTAVRVDMFGDEVESVREVFASTGQTIKDVSSVEIYPVCEMPLSKAALKRAVKRLDVGAKSNKQLRELREKAIDEIDIKSQHLLLGYLSNKVTTVADYMSDNWIVLFDEPTAIAMDGAKRYDELAQEIEKTSVNTTQLITNISDQDFSKWQNATFTSLALSGVHVDSTIKVMRSGLANAEIQLTDKINEWFDAGHYVFCCTSDANKRTSFESDFADGGISFVNLQECKKPRLGCVNMNDSSLPIGYVIPQAKLALFGDGDLRGQVQNFRRRNSIDITKVTFPYQIGDYVVHSNFGIAKFTEIVRRQVDNIKRDYIVLQYAENDKLYLPIEQFDRVTKYVGQQGDNPKLTRLNTKDWSKAISKARAATKRLAFDLVDVYSRRSNVKGFAFNIEKSDEELLSHTFPYQETPDQKIAIEEVFCDMSSSRVMDRLVCGDVGFGKTEVAIRATYIAKRNAKQTMILCPTTILAQQHYETFFERLCELGVSVDVISRFRTPKEQRETLKSFSEGKLDVLIGTHRLLSRDVNPKNLGLVVVDEEQRFGVGHKEQLKNLRETIDVLTLSATPIPRTLQMSLSGVRDMSLILTPPKNRRAVEVSVGVWDRDVVQSALRAELARGGQVYYVSNRVNSIEYAEERIRELVPEASIGVAHGQMSQAELESVMEDFAARNFDILIATTIIESGIDNPHTNTLIIEDSHRLGLAQMYQLKGRVGRSSSQAYAYFMYPEDLPLTGEARSRLLALGEHQELGSGLRIAMRDLEIRGAGNMFGAEQSGNLAAVGFDLFAAMLNDAIVAERSGEQWSDSTPQTLSDIVLNIDESAYISDDYIEDVNERVLLYRRLACSSDSATIDSIFSELQERYPEPPDETLSVFAKARLRVLCNDLGIKTISLAKGYLDIEPIDVSKDKQADLRRLSARYSAARKHLKIPSRNVALEGESFGAIIRFISTVL